jgi:hypothetical protein
MDKSLRSHVVQRNFRGGTSPFFTPPSPNLYGHWWATGRVGLQGTELVITEKNILFYSLNTRPKWPWEEDWAQEKQS